MKDNEKKLYCCIKNLNVCGRIRDFILFLHKIFCISPIARWLISVSSICMIWVFPTHSTSVKKNAELSVIFLQNGVLILNWKENKEAGTICFEIRIPTKKNKELLRKVPSKIYGVILIWKKTKQNFGLLTFPNMITEQCG